MFLLHHHCLGLPARDLCAAVFACSLVFSAGAGAQSRKEFYFQQYAHELGLSQGNVRCIEQDRQGFLWVGTEDGLNRFDGERFISYYHDSFDSTSLSNSRISCLRADGRGNLWVGTQEGLSLLPSGGVGFQRFRHRDADSLGLGNDEVTALLVDSEGVLWVGTAAGLDRFDPNTQEFTHHRHDPADSLSLSDNRVLCLWQDRMDSCGAWVGTVGGLNRLNLESGTFERIRVSSRRSRPHSIICILEVEAGVHWVGTAEGLWCQEPGSSEFTRRPLEAGRGSTLLWNPVITGLLKDSGGRIWVVTHDIGVWLLSPNKETLTRLVETPETPGSLNSNLLNCAFQDCGDLIWVGTRGYGLNAWDPYRIKFERHHSDYHDPNALSVRSVRSFYEDPTGRLWVGGYGNLNVYDATKGAFTSFDLGYTCIHAIQGDSEQPGRVLWLGTEGQGLQRYNVAEGTARSISNRQNLADAPRFIYAMRWGPQKGLWIASGRGVFRFDPMTGRITKFPGLDKQAPIKALEFSRDGRLWLGTSKGLARADLTTGDLVFYRHHERDPGSLSANGVEALHEDFQGILWVGTRGGGLDRLDSAGNHFIHYDMGLGLPNNTVYGVLEDDEGRLWLSTNAGICRFDPATETFRNFTSEDGLQHSEFNSGAYHRGFSGILYFGGINGLNIIRPGMIMDNPHPPPLAFTRVSVAGHPVVPGDTAPRTALLNGSISAAAELKLSPRDRGVSVDVAALGFGRFSRNRYAYKLEGVNSDWIDLGSQHSITFAELPYGTHKLLVKAANADGVRNEIPPALTLLVPRPFWRTSWFRLLGLVMGFGLLFVIYKLRTISIRRHARQIDRLNARMRENLQEVKMVESALRKSEELFRSIVEDQTEFIVRWLPGGQLTFVNEAYCRYFGLSRESLMGADVFHLISDGDQAAVQERLGQLSEKTPIVSGEHRVLLPDGTEGWSRWADRGFFDESGDLIEIQSVGRDITELKRTEAALRESHQRLQTLAESAFEGIVLVDNGYIMDANTSMAAMMGCDARDLVGRAFAEFVSPEGRERVAEQLRICSGLPYEYEIVRPDKSMLPVDIIIREMTIRKKPVAVTSIRDLSRHKTLQRDLRISEEKFSKAFRFSPNPIAIMDLETNEFLEVNAGFEKLFGYRREELIGKTSRMLFVDLAERARLLSTIKQKSQILEDEIRYKTKSGRHGVAEVSAEQFMFEDTAGVIIQLRDLTAQKAAEQEAEHNRQQLIQADRMVVLGTLVTGVAHEINNPNQYIMLNTPMLQQVWADTKPILDTYAREHSGFRLAGLPYTEMECEIPNLLSGILKGSQRMKAIVSQLREFAIVDEPTDNSLVDVNAVVAAAVDLASVHIKKATAHFSVAYAQDLPPIDGSMVRLEQVVINLVLNACQALTSPEMAIRVSTHSERERNRVIVLVDDEGRGIPEADLPKILDPFFTTKRDVGGTGLGLAVSSRIVEEHGGTLTYESRVGEGTRVRLVLPCAPQSTAAVQDETD